MSPVIHCVRHAQGIHNLTTSNHHVLDPLLTTYGEQQCFNFATEFPHHKGIELVVASPLRRTIHTALLAFAPEIERGLKILALPDIQETSSLPCDSGSELAQLREEFKHMPVDLSLVEDGWQLKVS